LRARLPGNTVHPSTLELLEDLGLYERLLALPHATFSDFPTHYADGTVSTRTPLHVSARNPRMLDVPQARLIALLVAETERYPNFELEMGALAETLLTENDVVSGVRYRAADGWHDVRATLVVGADGRFSKIRQLAGQHWVAEPEPFDVLCFQLPRSPGDPERAHGLYPGPDGLSVAVIAGELTWQVGCAFLRGGYQVLRAQGVETLRRLRAACRFLLTAWINSRVGNRLRCRRSISAARCAGIRRASSSSALRRTSCLCSARLVPISSGTPRSVGPCSWWLEGRASCR
jgi:hypothetical protein